ncbi:MAG: hypothetical protein ACK56F_17475 [bacterium]
MPCGRRSSRTIRRSRPRLMQAWRGNSTCTARTSSRSSARPRP